MLIQIDPRRKLAVQPGDISSMHIQTVLEGGRVLVLNMVSGAEIKVFDCTDRREHLDIDHVHQQLMEASK